MNTKEFKNGLLFASTGSLWWGVLGTYFFQYIAFVGTLEVVIHRCIWTSLILFITTIISVSYTHLTLPTNREV